MSSSFIPDNLMCGGEAVKRTLSRFASLNVIRSLIPDIIEEEWHDTLPGKPDR